MRRRVPRSPQKGFTLIELLVVIVIIAVMAGMAVLSLGNSGARAWSGEVQRLSNLLQLVADRALIDKAHYGVVLEPDNYSVVRYDPSTMKWQAPGDVAAGTGVERFTSHELPPHTRLEVLSQAELPMAEETEFAAEESEDEDGPKPQFVALSSGEILPVELAILYMSDGEVGRTASISYTSLYGLQLEWQADDD
ncbi:type II secretion system minor pseudopilin GspH [Microbulbifer halophilus]|uniref:Type II secretion system protein H n=1 Tax=Microbulbifer halophilus TaxID=453963 RepID=A0ABW5ECG9_9GAMM|nr:type II secretion system minor pseudopilin GspH [Microbulbifer halophilus]MCW8125999.1 type II secretion system minor pseudopilin GspH [Microbulbifer halophilus]